jgi:hypothetical protein
MTQPTIRRVFLLLVAFSLAAKYRTNAEDIFQSENARDTFGIQQIYDTRTGSKVWTSAHWEKATYTLDERIDSHDPQGISGKRGSGMLTVADGVLTMAGEQPRLYIYPYAGFPWRDVEVTAYYMRVTDAAVAYAGMVAGIRSGPEGHSDNPCDAHTYYGRMRHDGAFDFDKELKHPHSTSAHRVPADEAWPDGKLPRNRWIGFKFIGYNDGGVVKLETYRDLTEGQNGGTWEKVNSATDQTGWFASTDCALHNPTAGRSDVLILDGGTVLIRNTNIEDARYRWVSVREIQRAK